MTTRPSQAVQVVGVMAFGQSLLFLAVWLIVCWSAGATAVPPAKSKQELKPSTYETAAARDPFRKRGPSAVAAIVSNVSLDFRLQGILYSASRPSAMVNNALIELNKPVTLTCANGQIQVKAVEITRDKVVLEVGGQRIELRLAGPDPLPKRADNTESKVR